LRFIFLIEKPFSEHDANRFGVKTLKEKGFDVEAWDVGPLCAPGYPRDGSAERPNIEIKAFESYESLRCALSALSPDDVILGLAGMSLEQAWPYRRLRKAVFNAPARIATITNGHSPFDRWYTTWDKLRNLFSAHLGIAAFARRLAGFMVYEAKTVVGTALTLANRHSLDYVFAGVSILGLDQRLIGKKTKIFHIHNLDADALLNVENSGIATQEKHIVYLDSMGPLHPELTAYQISFGIGASEFFSSNLQCLVHLQKQLNMPCVVAAHPRTQPGQLDAFFAPYPVFHQQTPELVAQSVCVIAEPSLSLGMAAWFNKPAIILWHRDLPDWNKQLLKDFQDALGCAVWDVADEKTWVIPRVDPVSYGRYRENYLKKPGTTDKPFWEFVAEKLLMT